jgi:hypothetical protein
MLFHNDGNANAWLNVKLIGTVSNRSGIGAKVRVMASYRGAARWQLRTIISGDGESNQSNALNATFGLADATVVDTVRVEWPSGIVQELHDVTPRQFLTVTEPSCANADHGRDLLPASHPRLTLAQVNTDTTAGNDRLTLAGEFALPPAASFSTFDGVADGALVVLRSHTGDLRLDAHLPPGDYHGRGTRGWQRSKVGSRWTYLDQTPRPIGGIVKLVATDGSKGAPGGTVRVSAFGKHGNYGVRAGDEPVQATVVLGGPEAAAAGSCGESTFTAPDCAFNPAGRKLTCQGR